MIGASAGHSNYLMIGLLVGTLAGFLAGAVLMLQIGDRTASVVRGLWNRRPGGSRVRFELLSQ